MSEKEVSIVIPARMGSTRLPGKPLKVIAGKPLVYWVIKAALKVKKISKLILASDHAEILKVASELGIESILTSTVHKSGTERLLEVAEKVNSDFFINLQGDEPLIEPADIEYLIEKLTKSNFDIVTLAHNIGLEDAKDPSKVKVISNYKNEAIYFSRNIIPYGAISFKQHVGIYGFTKKSLKLIENFSETNLEKLESLEQLRWLENNLKIGVFNSQFNSIGVDTIQDLKRVEKILMLRKLKILFSDVDGILTDGKIWYGNNGEELKGFHSRDGLAIKLLMKNGIQFALISARDSRPLRKRANDLGINHCIFGLEDKVEGCEEILSQLNIDRSNAAYIGDDNIDITAMDYCGISFTVSDAVKPVLAKANIVLKSKGGEGAIREVADMIFSAK